MEKVYLVVCFICCGIMLAPTAHAYLDPSVMT